MKPIQSQQPNTAIRAKKIRYFIGICVFISSLYILDMMYFPTLEISVNNLNLLRSWHYCFSLLSILISFILIVVFAYSAQIGPTWLKIIYVIYFSITISLEYSFFAALKRPLNQADLKMGTDSSLKLWLDAAQLFFRWQAFIPILFFIIFLLAYRNHHAPQRGLWLSGIWIVTVFGMSLIPDRPVPFIHWGSAPIHFTSVVCKFTMSHFSPRERQTLSFHSTKNPENNIVFIVDESISADHLSLNGYKFATTPYLDTLAENKALLHNWGVAVTGSTCSESANALLITGVTVTNEQYDLTYRYPTIFQYAKAMRYTTYYFDAQASALWTGLSEQDLVYIDHWVNIKELGDTMFSDFTAAERIRRIVSEGTGNFILVNKRGTHWVYDRTYPASAANWTPDNYVNIYNNAIRYNLNNFFQTLFPDPELLATDVQNTIYLYTSDHSETLFENGAGSPHCGATLPEARVPLFIIGQLSTPVDVTYPASHSNILPTILDLMKYPQDATPPGLNISLLKATGTAANDRFFFVGNTEESINYDVLNKNGK